MSKFTKAVKKLDDAIKLAKNELESNAACVSRL